MAKKITDEKLSLSIVINGNQAQKELLDLEKSTRKLNESQKELRAEKKKLEQDGKKESARYKEVTAAIKSNTQTLNSNKVKMQELQKQIGITGLTMAQLQTKATHLKLVLRNLIPGSADHKRYQAELNQVNARLSELRGKAQAAKFSLGGLADGFNRYQALAFSVVASMTGIVLSIQKIIDINGKLSDAQADVMKTTQLTKKEVDELTKSFGLMKTRTARIELLKLAEEGGRLGIEGVENIKSFVNVANQMKVALGDDLSDTQIREVGKIVDVYKVGAETGRDFEGAMLSLGSAINEVAATGSNQAGFLVDFLKRTGGISKQIRLSAADNIGYAATFDEIGLSQEVTATAMNKIWIEMAKDTTEFAKVSEMSVKDFTELFEKDANQAMITFLKGLEKNSGSASKLMKSLSEIEAGGTRGDSAIIGLAGSIEKLTIKQRIANESLWEASSLTDEYNVKNENLAATLEKINKTVMGWFSSESFINWLANVVDKFALLIGATEATDEEQKKWRNTVITITKVLLILTATILSYNAGLKLATLWSTRNTQATLLYNVAAKARAVIEAGAILRTQAWAAITMLLSGNVKGATQALRVMNSVIKANPFGLLLAAIVAVVGAMKLFGKETEKVVDSQTMLNNIRREATASIEGEKNQLKSLLSIAQDETKSKEQRLLAIKKLNEISPEYLGHLNLENIRTKEATASINKYIESLSKKAMMQAFESKQSALAQKKIDALGNEEHNKNMLGFNEVDLQAAYDIEQRLKEKENDVTAAEEIFFHRIASDYARRYNAYKKGISAVETEQEKLNKLQADFIQKNAELYLDSETTDDEEEETGEDDKAKKAREKREAEFQKLLEDLKRQRAELLKLQDDAKDDELSILEHGYEKERDILKENHQRKIRDLKAQLIDEAEIQKAQDKSEDTGLSNKERSFWVEQKEVWVSKNQAINSRIENDEYIHNLNLATIQEKFFTEAIKNLENQYNRERQNRETAYLNEIAGIETLDEAKAKLSAFLSQRELARIKDVDKAKEILRKNFQQQELDSQKKFIEQQIEQLERVVSGQDNTMGVDFNILSDEQKNKFIEDIEVLKKAYAELLALKRGNGEQEDSFGQASMSTFGNADVLGFTVEQWASTFQNLDTLSQKLKAGDMIVSGLQNMWGQYNAYVTASENASLRKYESGLDKRKAKLKQQLDQGYINQVQYKRGVEALEDDVAKKRAELEYKQAKRDRDMAVVNAIINTARGVTAALGQAPPMSFVLAGLTAAMGALQIMTIRKQPLPARGYEDGLYPDYIKREQDGKVFKAGYGGKTRSGMVNKPTYFLAGEGSKPEMVIDSATYKKLDPELRNALVRQLQGIKGFEGGYYSPETQRIEIPVNNTSSDSNRETQELMSQFYEILNRTTSVLEKIEEKGLTAVVSSKDYKSIRELRDATTKLEKVEKNSKIG